MYKLIRPQAKEKFDNTHTNRNKSSFSRMSPNYERKTQTQYDRTQTQYDRFINKTFVYANNPSKKLTHNNGLPMLTCINPHEGSYYHINIKVV